MLLKTYKQYTNKFIIFGASPAGDISPAGAFGIFLKTVITDCKIIAADGGVAICRSLEITPDYCIGDFDSALSEDIAFINRIADSNNSDFIQRLPIRKDDTDVVAAIRFAVSKGADYIYLVGCLGGDIGHSIANIQCLSFMKTLGICGEILHPDSNIALIDTKGVVLTQYNHRFSVFSLSDCSTGVSISGASYETNGVTISNTFPIGVGNIGLGNDVSITYSEGTLVLVYKCC